MRLIGLGLLLLASCSGGSAGAERTEATPSPAATRSPAPRATSAPTATPSIVEEKTTDFSFSFRYPAAVARIPALAASLDGERDRLRRSTARAAATDRSDASKSGRPFHAYESTVNWQVVADTPGFLSLSARLYSFTGGAHGSPGFAALVWDKRAGVRRKPTELFDTAELERAAIDAYCRAIDGERHKRRLYPIDASTEDPFSECPKVSDATLILGSSDRRHFDKLGFLIDPYVAGPFAEGTYEVTVPVTPAILAAVKAEYRDAFRVR